MQKINLGCGFAWRKDGWIGVDWDETSAAWKNEGENACYVNSNVLTGLPFDDESADLLYTSHMLEHFTYFEGIQVMAEIHRVLKPGGILGLIVPDLDIYLERFQKQDSVFLTTPDIIGGNPRDNYTDNFLMNFYSDPSFLNSCHKYSYNFENMSALLRRFGFENIQKVPYQCFTYCQELNDESLRCLSEHADQFSLSIECVKGTEPLDYTIIQDYTEGKRIIGKASQTLMSLHIQLESALKDAERLSHKCSDIELRLENSEKETLSALMKTREEQGKSVVLESMLEETRAIILQKEAALLQMETIQAQVEAVLGQTHAILSKTEAALADKNEVLALWEEKYYSICEIAESRYREINLIKNSKGWRCVLLVRRIKDKIMAVLGIRHNG